MGRVEGQVAFVTGAARGQGRSHAVRLAQEGADIIAVDIGAQIDSVPMAMATPEDLDETRRQVLALGRRIVATQVDVRDAKALAKALDDGVSQLGHVDVVVANAGIVGYGLAHNLEEQAWHDVLDVNLTGVWHTAKAAIPHLIEQGRGGSIVLVGSTRGVSARPNLAHYVAAKHGVVGLMRSLALELAPHRIRVNCVHPGGVDTDMIHNPATYALFAPDLPEHERTRQRLRERFQALNVLPVPWVDPVEISHAVLFLASDEARYITGVALPVDAGSTLT